MSEKKDLELIDYLIILIKWKKFLIITFLSIIVISYLCIFFFIEEQYSAKALLIPAEQNQLGGFSSLLKDFSSLPLNIGGLSNRNDIDLYTTIIYSRTNLEKVINKFNLIENYEVENTEEAIKVLKSKIETEESDEEAFEINVRAETPKKASKMANFIVDELNRTVIEMNVKKSRENRIFLEKRYAEIKTNLENAEDSLRYYQQSSGIYLAEDQAKSVIDAYTKLETELAKKQIELSVYEKIYGEDSPQANNSRIAVKQFSDKINDLKKGSKNNLIVGISSLPEKAMNYLRYYRDVEIYNAMLEFIIPLYEQTRFEEQKDIPILQVIDYAVPPIKRIYPKRVFTSIIIALIVVSLSFFVILFKEYFNENDNPKVNYIRKNILNFKKN